VRGSGDDVKVTYHTEEAGLVERTVNLPWTSEEFRGTKQSPVHIEAPPSGQGLGQDPNREWVLSSVNNLAGNYN
jgi:hypothetical protein